MALWSILDDASSFRADLDWTTSFRFSSQPNLHSETPWAQLANEMNSSDSNGNIKRMSIQRLKEYLRYNENIVAQAPLLRIHRKRIWIEAVTIYNIDGGIIGISCRRKGGKVSVRRVYINLAKLVRLNKLTVTANSSAIIDVSMFSALEQISLHLTAASNPHRDHAQRQPVDLKASVCTKITKNIQSKPTKRAKLISVLCLCSSLYFAHKLWFWAWMRL